MGENVNDFVDRMRDINRVTRLQLEEMKVLVDVEEITDYFMKHPEEAYKIFRETCPHYGSLVEFFKGQGFKVHVDHPDYIVCERKIN